MRECLSKEGAWMTRQMLIDARILILGLLSGRMTPETQFIGEDLRQIDPKFNRLAMHGTCKL
jgi:hypothetical protein